jgi:hypothetical protein
MEKLRLNLPSKSSHTIKLRRKVKNNQISEDAEDPSTDYLLEKEGDITDFLKPKKNCLEPITTQEPLSRSYIGNLSHYNRSRKDSQSQGKKTVLIKKKKLESEIDPQQTFKNMLDKINTLRARSQAVEEKKVKKSKWNKFELKEAQAIQSFQTMSKYWKGLENSIASKSNKKANDLLYTKHKDLRTKNPSPSKYFDKEQIQDKYSWYIGLRDDKSSDRVDVILPVFNKVTGNFTRYNVCRSPDGEVDPNDEGLCGKLLKEEDLRELQIIGIQKLPMEVEAVKRIGPQYLKPALFDGPCEEETYAEQYDAWTKARKL